MQASRKCSLFSFNIVKKIWSLLLLTYCDIILKLNPLPLFSGVHAPANSPPVLDSTRLREMWKTRPTDSTGLSILNVKVQSQKEWTYGLFGRIGKRKPLYYKKTIRLLEQCPLYRWDQSEDVWPVATFGENQTAYQQKHIASAVRPDGGGLMICACSAATGPEQLAVTKSTTKSSECQNFRVKGQFVWQLMLKVSLK